LRGVGDAVVEAVEVVVAATNAVDQTTDLAINKEAMRWHIIQTKNCEMSSPAKRNWSYIIALVATFWRSEPKRSIWGK
jgi:hypothetical protein